MASLGHKFGYYRTKTGVKYAIGLVRAGCANRPFFQVVVATRKKRLWEGDIVEQLGNYDPVPNGFDEKLISLNFDRVRHWLGREETAVSVPVLELLGYCGLLPIHPITYVKARETKEWLEEFSRTAKKQLEENKVNWPIVEEPVMEWDKRGIKGRKLRRQREIRWWKFYL